jgi:hypothetical protein
MYAVIYKNRVIVGPMAWNRGIFQGSLEKEGVRQTIPRVAPQELPYKVTEDAKIMLVQEVRPEINTMVEYYYGPLWDVTGNNAVASYEVHDSSVESARVNFKNQTAEERWKKEIAGIKVTIQNVEVSVPTERDARNIFVQKYSSMTENETVNWKFPETWLTLTKTELGKIVSAGAAHIQSCFDWEKSINDQIDAANTKEALVAIEIVEVQQSQS